MRTGPFRRTGYALLALVAVVTAGCEVPTATPPTTVAPTTTPGATTPATPPPGTTPSSTPPIPPVSTPPTTTPPVTTPLPADAKYVAPDGEDTNPGTAEQPWATVAHAVEAAPAGGTVALRAGLYREGDLAVRKHLTVRSVPGERAELRGSVVVDRWARDGDDWCTAGWTPAFPPSEREGPEYLDEQFPMASHHDQVFVADAPLTQVATRGAVADGSFHVDYAADRLCMGTDPTGQTVEATASTGGLALWGIDAEGTSRIEGLTMSHYAEAALTVGRPGTVVQDNVFRRMGISGVELSGGGDQRPTDVVVRGNLFELNGRRGVGGGLADRLLFEGNRVRANNTENYAVTWAAAGAKFIRGVDQVFRDNVFEGNNATGLWLDIANDRATIVGNVARDNRTIGIFFEISEDALIVDNVAQSNGVGIMVADSAGAEVVNNTLWDNNTNLTVKDGARVAPVPNDTGATFDTRRTAVVNNIFSDARSARQVDTSRIDDESCGSGQPSMFSTVDHNGYHRTTAARPANVVRWVEQPPQCTAEYASVAQFRDATSREDHGVGLDGAPTFVDAAAGDFRLVPGSPFVGAGAPLSTAAANAAGVPQGSPVNLGALTPSAP